MARLVRGLKGMNKIFMGPEARMAIRPFNELDRGPEGMNGKKCVRGPKGMNKAGSTIVGPEA